MKRVLLSTLLGVFGLSAVAHANPVLTLRTPCFDTVRLTGDSSLSSAVAAIDGSSAHITFVATENAGILQGTRCDGSQDITLRVKPGTDIVITDGGSTEYAISHVEGGLIATLGSGDLRDDHATQATLRLTSSGDVSIAAVDGPLYADMRGSGDVRIARIANGPLLNVSTYSSGDFELASGQVSDIAAQAYGSGSITLRASTQRAKLASYSSGDISLDRVTDSLSRHNYGSGDVSVRSMEGARISDTANFTIPPIPPVPPMPPMSVDGGQSVSITPSGIVIPGVATISSDGSVVLGHNGAGKTHDYRGLSELIGTIFGVFLTVVLLGGSGLILLAYLRRGKGGLARNPGPDPRVERLMQDLAALEPRLARIEHYITSQDFELRRELRALERN